MKNDIKTEKTGIVKSLEYMLSTLKEYQKLMLKSDTKRPDHVWSLVGLVIVPPAHLMKLISKKVDDSLSQEGANAKEDLLQVKKEFCQFMDKMIDYQDIAEKEKES